MAATYALCACFASLPGRLYAKERAALFAARPGILFCFEVIFMKEKQSRARKRAFTRVPNAFSEPAGPILSDVQGSYTGNPLDGEQPVQDADDL